MNIITGYRDEPHYTQQQMRDENISVYGDGVYILNVGSKMSATVVSANEVSIADGLVVAQGCTAEVVRGTTESITVENGEHGMLRKDLIVLRYTRDASTNVEDMQLDIIKGTSATSNPSVPTYTSGSIADGDTLVEFPLYEVNLSGITIQSVVLLATEKSIADKKSVDYLSAKIGTGTLSTTAKNLIGAVNELLSKLGTGTLSTTAKNVIGAVNELLGKINTANSNISSNTTKINTANSNITAVANRATALENKTAGIVKSISYDVAASSNNYKELNASSMYLLILNGGTTSNTVRGIYQIGVTDSKLLGIKAISAASIAEVTDGGSGLLKVHNTGSVVLRATLITTYGS